MKFARWNYVGWQLDQRTLSNSVRMMSINVKQKAETWQWDYAGLFECQLKSPICNLQAHD